MQQVVISHNGERPGSLNDLGQPLRAELIVVSPKVMGKAGRPLLGIREANQEGR